MPGESPDSSEEWAAQDPKVVHGKSDPISPSRNLYFLDRGLAEPSAGARRRR